MSGNKGHYKEVHQVKKDAMRGRCQVTRCCEEGGCQVTKHDVCGPVLAGAPIFWGGHKLTEKY